MEDFRKKFIEEANEYLNELENTHLELEIKANDKSLIDKTFRVMHSLKGGGAMFGFEERSNFTHHMESIYDEVRKGEMMLSRELFSITLESVDHLRDLLTFDVLPPDVALLHYKLQQRIEDIVKNKDNDKYKVPGSGEQKEVSKEEKTYETPVEHLKKGKLEQGTIKMKAYYSGSNVNIEISDDRKGINIDVIKPKAIEQNIIKPEDVVNTDDLLNLIFMSGFSTASKVSDISGRGVGMDVVKKKISDIPFLKLNEEFEFGQNTSDGFQMIVVNYSDRKIGLVVDSIIGEYQAVLKPIGKYYKDQEFISGASILGDGTIALVMDTDKAISHFDREKGSFLKLSKI